MSIRFNSPYESQALGARLRSARKKAGITLEKAASMLDVTHSQLSRIERGQAVTHSNTVRKFCTLLNIALPAKVGRGGTSATQLGDRVRALVSARPETALAIKAALEALEAMPSYNAPA